MRCVVLLAFALALLGCGARSSLDEFPRDAGAPATPELCNGLDDDEDGRVDEGVPGTVFFPATMIRDDADEPTGWVPVSRLLQTSDGLRALMRINPRTEENLFLRPLAGDGRATRGPWRPASTSELQGWFPSVRRDEDGGYSAGTIITNEGGSWVSAGRFDATVTSVELTPIERVRDNRYRPSVATFATGTTLVAYSCDGRGICLARLDETPVRLTSSLSDRVGADLTPLSAPVMVARGDEAAVAVIRVEDGVSELFLFVVDEEGRVVNETVSSLPSGATTFKPFNNIRLFATDRGYFLMFVRRDVGRGFPADPSGRWVVRFDRDGERTSGPTNFEPEVGYYGESTLLEPHPGGGYLMSGVRARALLDERPVQEGYLAQLDESGAMIWELVAPSLDHAIVTDEGEVFGIFNEATPRRDGNPLSVAKLNCAPI